MKDIALNKHSFNFKKYEYPEGIEITPSPSVKAYSFIIPKKGSVEVKTERISLTVNAGDIAFIPIEMKVSITYSPESRGDLLQFLYWPDVVDFAFPIQKLEMDKELYNCFNALPNYNDDVDSTFIWRSYQFLDVVQERLLENNFKDTKIIQKAIVFMHENDRYAIPDLAKLCNMSESKFYLLFNKIVGMTPIKMKHKIQIKRMEKAIKPFHPFYNILLMLVFIFLFSLCFYPFCKLLLITLIIYNIGVFKLSYKASLIGFNILSAKLSLLCLFLLSKTFGFLLSCKFIYSFNFIISHCFYLF